MLVTLSTLTRARCSQNSCGSFCKSNICERKLRLPQPSTSRVKCGTLPPNSTLDVWLRGSVISAQSQVWEVGDGFLIVVMELNLEPVSPMFRSATNAVIRRAKPLLCVGQISCPGRVQEAQCHPHLPVYLGVFRWALFLRPQKVLDQMICCADPGFVWIVPVCEDNDTKILSG